jgi:hypothetical protein
MKYIYLFFVVFTFAGCTGSSIEITGIASGLTEGTVTLKDGEGEILSGVNIINGKFHIDKTWLKYSYYGTIMVSQAGKDGKDFELYLEPSQYTIILDKNSLNYYPKITSNSNIQNQLSTYHQLYESMRDAAQQRQDALDEKYKIAVKSSKNWDNNTTIIANQLQIAQVKTSNINPVVLAVYVDKYPENEIAAHIMHGLDFEGDPAGYYAIYKTFSPSQKNTDEGKEIGERLSAIIKLKPGALAPEIAGTMPDGKPVDLKALNKKLILIEFWKAANYKSRINHQVMINKPPPFMTNKELGIVSISFDKKRDWWLGSMRDDKLTWTQVSDLKGIDSPNMNNWGIEDLPTYYLLDGTGHILERDVSFNQITSKVDYYLAHH